MRTLLTIAATVLLVSGCQAPGDIRATGSITTWRSPSDPRVVARCIARQTGEMSSGTLTAEERGGGPDGTYEVIVRSAFEVANAIAVADIRPVSEGTEVRLAVGGQLLRPGPLQQRLKNC